MVLWLLKDVYTQNISFAEKLHRSHIMNSKCD